MPNPLRSISLALALAAVLSGCGSLRPTAVPLRTIERPAQCGTGAHPDTLLVLLPGSSSSPEEFEQEGFVQTIRRNGLAADVVLVDAHPGYYFDKTIVDRLRADVVAPALARGYRRVWLVGISIGGLGTMLYAQMRPQDIAGVVALAPYLGTRLTAQDIENAGGLSQWLAPPFSVWTDLDAGLWRWLQVQTTGAPVSGDKTPLFRGYGLSDRFVFNARLLDRALPRDRVFTAKGGHDWPVWNDLWQQMAAQLPIEHRDDCLCQGPG